MAGRAGAVAAGRRRARHARPPVHLAQQRQRSLEEDRFQALAPVTVSAFLESYGYETRTDSETWRQVKNKSKVFRK